MTHDNDYSVFYENIKAQLSRESFRITLIWLFLFFIVIPANLLFLFIFVKIEKEKVLTELNGKIDEIKTQVSSLYDFKSKRIIASQIQLSSPDNSALISMGVNSDSAIIDLNNPQNGDKIGIKLGKDEISFYSFTPYYENTRGIKKERAVYKWGLPFLHFINRKDNSSFSIFTMDLGDGPCTDLFCSDSKYFSSIKIFPKDLAFTQGDSNYQGDNAVDLRFKFDKNK